MVAEKVKKREKKIFIVCWACTGPFGSRINSLFSFPLFKTLVFVARVNFLIFGLLTQFKAASLPPTLIFFAQGNFLCEEQLKNLFCSTVGCYMQLGFT